MLDAQLVDRIGWTLVHFLFVALMAAAASVVTVTPESVAGEEKSKPNVRLRLHDAEGKRLMEKMTWQAAYRGWRKAMPNQFYTSDERGRLEMNLDPGKHAIVWGIRESAAVLEFDVPPGGLKTKINLPPKPAPWPGSSGYPDLDVRAEVRDDKHLGEEFVVLKISNNRDTPYTLHKNDLTFTTTDIRVYPPKSQQRTGLVIPPKGEGEKVISLAWHEYVRDGIWTARTEPISEPWPATVPKPGKTWFRPNVGITGALPVQVTMPAVVLDPQSFDPRTLKEYTGGLSGRFVFDGERPKPKRVLPFGRSTLDGREFELADDRVLKENEVFDESLVVNKDGGVANIVVWIRNKDVPVPLVDKQHVSLRVKKGRFNPHITLLQPSQDLSISNEEKFGVNFHVQALRNESANMLLQANHSISHRFNSAEPGPLKVQCNIHSWMSGWLILRENPFMAVSSEDGTFEIKGLPPGEWEFQFWHEMGGYLARDGWPRGRVTIKIEDETHDLGTIRLTKEELGVGPPAADTAADPSEPPPAAEAEPFDGTLKPTSKVLDSKHPIWRAVASLDRKQVLELLKGDPKLIDRQGEKGFVLLHSAAMSGKLKQVELLLDVGANPNARQTTYGGTPLQYAAYRGHLEVCKALLRHDASVDSTDVFGRTPLMWAAMYGNTEVAAFLIEHGADVNARTTSASAGSQSGKGAAALHLAVEKKHDEVVALLLKHGADRNLPDAAGRTPFAEQKPPVEERTEDTWYRDAPYPAIGFAQPDEIDRTYVRIVSHLPAHRELGLSNTQSAVLRQLGAWAMQDFYDVKVNDREGRQAVWAKARKRAEKLLDEQQLKRLEQLFIQQRRTEVFMNPKLLPELRITDEQRAQIQDKWRQHLKRIPKKTARNAENAGKGHASYRRFWAEVREILTVEQRNTFEQLRGPPPAKFGPSAQSDNNRTGAIISPQFEPAGQGLSVEGSRRNGADVTNPADAPSSEKIGEVFGEPIYRHQLPKVDKDDAIRNQLFRLLITPIMKRYREEHAADIELTDQEILDAIKFFEERARKNGGQAAEWWYGIVSREKKDAPRQLEAGEKALAEVDPNDAERRKLIERHVEIARKTAKHPGYGFLSFFLGNLKFQRHLYDEFGGGRILFQQAGLEAFDATHNWLLKHEKAGDFRVNDPELRAKLFEYWTRDHGAFLQGEKGKSDPNALTLKGIYAGDK